jgi:hypothetical protein
MAETQRVSPSSSRTAGQPSLPDADPGHDKPRASTQPLSRTEKTLRGVLLLGMASTAAVLLTTGPALPNADILLGSTILFAGISLLVVIELCRR